MTIIQFQQRVNKLFFDDDDKYDSYQTVADKALKEYLKIKDSTDADLKKCERIVAKALEDYCDVNGKSLVWEIARKLCRSYCLREIVSWTFSINEVFEDNMYNWMF